MLWFVSYHTDAGEQIKKFHTIDMLWEWLHEFVAHQGSMPHQWCVYKAECSFDGS